MISHIQENLFLSLLEFIINSLYFPPFSYSIILIYLILLPFLIIFIWLNKNYFPYPFFINYIHHICSKDSNIYFIIYLSPHNFFI